MQTLSQKQDCASCLVVMMDMAPSVSRAVLVLIFSYLFQLIGAERSFSNHLTLVDKSTLVGVRTPYEADTLPDKIRTTVAPSEHAEDMYGLQARCFIIHDNAKKLKKSFQVVVEANLTISCYWDNFLEIQSSSESRRSSIGRELLPNKCLAMEADALAVRDPPLHRHLKINSIKCVMEANIFILCSRLGRSDCKKVVMICSRLKPNDLDRFRDNALFYLANANYMECLLLTAIAFRTINDNRPPLQGMHALTPLRPLDGWCEMWRTGGNVIADDPVSLKARTDSLDTVRFIGDATIECKPKWRTRYPEQFSFISDLMKTIGEHIGSPKCTNVPQDDFKTANLLVLLGIADVYVTDTWAVTGNLLLYPHDQNDLCVLAHKQMPERRNMVDAYSSATWATTGVALLALAAVVRLAGGQPALLRVLRAFIAGDFNDRQGPLSNFFFVLISSFGLIMLNAFAGVFTSFLTVPGEKPQWQTLKEVARHVDVVLASPSFLNLKSDDEAISRLQSKLRLGDSQWVAHLDNVAFVGGRNHLEFLRIHPFYVDESGAPLTHIVPQCAVSPGFVTTGVRQHWPGKEAFIIMLQRLLQAGMREKVKRAFRQLALAQARARTAGLRALALADVVQPAILWAGGLLLAAAAFALECAWTWTWFWACALRLAQAWRPRAPSPSPSPSSRSGNDNVLFR